ncbi:MAG: chemotaxis protein CheD [Roseovarius sp.]|nr:chemotaxis protein CheD [Roseovarius sp.]
MKDNAAKVKDRTIHIIQGEFRVSDTPGDMLSTVLGSCVATCIYDPVRMVGGMNHYLLPTGVPTDVNLKYGAHAMELLLNELYKKGAVRERLEAKVFGGARMLKGLPNIGGANAEFAQWFLKTENIRCVLTSVGGTRARKIRFWPCTGKAQQMTLDEVNTDPAAMASKADTHEVELF